MSRIACGISRAPGAGWGRDLFGRYAGKKIKAALHARR